MKIAIIAPTEIPSLRANTIQVMKMAQAIATLGHDIRVFVPTSLYKDQARVSERSEINGKNRLERNQSWEEIAHHYGLHHQFPIIWLPANQHLRRYDFSVTAVRWINSWGADFLYTRLPQAAALASQLGTATILELHDLPRGFWWSKLIKLFLKGRGARRLIAITKGLADELLAKYSTSQLHSLLVVSPDGVDLERYKKRYTPEEARSILNENCELNQKLDPSMYTAGYTGHMYAGRGIKFILEIASHLPDICFLIAGGEPDHVRSIKSEVTTLNLKNVLITGFVPNAQLPLFQSACDILLMPYQNKVAASSGGDISRYLSPMKVFEYLACGRTIVTSDLPVLSEVLNENNAVILPASNVDVWVRTLKDLLSDPERRIRLSAQALEDAKQYSWENRAIKILKGLTSGE